MTFIRQLLDNAKYSWILIFAIISGVISINVYLAIKTINELSATQKGLTNTGEIILALDKLHILVLSAETGQRGYLLTEDEAYLAPYKKALSNVAEQVSEVKQLRSDMLGLENTLEELLNTIDQKLIELTYTVDLALEDKEKSALKTVMTGRGKNLYAEINILFDNLQHAEVKHRNNLYYQLETIEKEAVYTFAISAITSFLLLLGLWVLVRLNNKAEQRHRVHLEQQNEKLAEQVKIRTKEITLYAEELSRSNRELEDFAFVASHDLQEPLRKIRAFGDRLMTNYSQNIDTTGQDYLKRMGSAAERMSNLIRDLLEYSRINTRGKEFVVVSLERVVNDVISDLEIAIEESETTLNIQPLPEIKGDISQLNQLFLNLLSNAIKFRKENTHPVIDISYHEENEFDEILNKKVLWHIIQIKDNGIGFEQEFEDKVFVPFQRLHSRSQYKGTGIGLAVCRRIVERHGGYISVVSKKDNGCEFTIKIPHNFTLNEAQ